MDIGSRLRELRQKAGFSGNALARKAGVAQSTVSEIEAGHALPSLSTLSRLCEAMGITLGDFFGTTAREPLPPRLRYLLALARRLEPKELNVVILVAEGLLSRRGRQPRDAVAEGKAPYGEEERDP